MLPLKIRKESDTPFLKSRKERIMEKKSLFEKVKDIPVIALCSECDDGQTEIAMSLTTKEVRCVLSGALAGTKPCRKMANRLYIYTTENEGCVDIEIRFKSKGAVVESLGQYISLAFNRTLVWGNELKSDGEILNHITSFALSRVCGTLGISRANSLYNRVMVIVCMVCRTCFDMVREAFHTGEGFSGICDVTKTIKACLATEKNRSVLASLVDDAYDKLYSTIGRYDDAFSVKIDVNDPDVRALWAMFVNEYESRYEQIIDYVTITLPMNEYVEDFVRQRDVYSGEDGCHWFAILDMKSLFRVKDMTDLFNYMLEIYNMCDAVAVVWELPSGDYTPHSTRLFEVVEDIRLSEKKSTPVLFLYSGANKSVEAWAAREGEELPVWQEDIDFIVNRAINEEKDRLEQVGDIEKYPYYVCDDGSPSLGNLFEKYSAVYVMEKILSDVIG